MHFFTRPLAKLFSRLRLAPIGVMLLLVLCSFLLGGGLAQAIAPTPQSVIPASIPASIPESVMPESRLFAGDRPILLAQTNQIPTPTNPTDTVPERFQQGQALYLQNCATCHLALPPAVMPTQTWRDLIQDPEHYGAQITPLLDPYRLALWQYLQVYSRPVKKDENVPYRLTQSRPFKALHPRVRLPMPVTIASCAACHPAAAQFNFRSLSPDWEAAP